MPESIGKCECIYTFNKSVLLGTLSKEDTRLSSEIDRLSKNRETLGEEFVQESINLLMKEREYFNKVKKIVANTPSCISDSIKQY